MNVSAARAAAARRAVRPQKRPRTIATENRAPTLRVQSRSAFPLPVNNFRVFIGKEEVHVATISPLHLATSEFDAPDFRQTVILTRAVGQSRVFYDWNLACMAGKKDIRPVTIALLDSPDGKPAGMWQLTGARPVRWTGPAFDAMAVEIAMEELELTYESIAWRSRI